MLIRDATGHYIGLPPSAPVTNHVDVWVLGPVRCSEREGRIQSAERAVPTLVPKI